MKRLIIALCCLCCTLFIKAQETIAPATKEVRATQRIMWWNVENLFDTQHDTLRKDHEFLPDGKYRWTPHRYWRKLDNIARTVAAVAEENGWPVLVGLGEVENDTVLRDLTRRSPLRTAGYQYIHEESPDERGIDVALLYHPSLFTPEGWQAVRIPSAEHGLRPTRDILHVWGRLAQAEERMHVLTLHFPSRAGGTPASTQNRRLATERLCALLDSLAGEPVLVMGDFNAEHGDEVFRLIGERLTTLMPTSRKELKKPHGTYFYQDTWGYLDHILVSQEMLHHTKEKAVVGRFAFLLTEKGTPWRTFQGPAYKGGYSDHLPIWVDLLSR